MSPGALGGYIASSEVPVGFTPVRVCAFKSDLEMLNHIYMENISAERGLAMLEQRDRTIADMTVTEQRHDSL